MTVQTSVLLSSVLGDASSLVSPPAMGELRPEAGTLYLRKLHDGKMKLTDVT